MYNLERRKEHVQSGEKKGTCTIWREERNMYNLERRKEQVQFGEKKPDNINLA